MGVIAGDPNDGPSAKAKDDLDVHADQPQDDSKGVKTDVDGVYADGEKGGVPVFDVTQAEFYDNMKNDRQRLRFKTGTAAQSYHKQSNYRRPFYIRNKDDGYMRMYK